MPIKFGPAGLGPIKEAVDNLKHYHDLGFKACELAFTHGVYIKKDNDIKMIREAAEKYDITLSIHAPYWINLNAQEPQKLEMSKKRIISCLDVGEKLGVYRVVIHPGYYMGMDKEETYQNIKKAILELQEIIKENNWKIKLAPETMGKVNVFGSYKEIAQLVKYTGCDFCIDFAHLLARDKSVNYKKVIEAFPQKTWHVHFSGIVYGEKGEKRHKTTLKSEWKELLKNLPKDKDIIIVNESPSMVEDSKEGLEIYEKLKN